MNEPGTTLINLKSPEASSGPQFHLFSRLPAELRIMIWKRCLPERVIEVNHPQWLAAEIQCDGEQTSKRNNLPPGITYVNWEAHTIDMDYAATKALVGPQDTPSSACGFRSQRKQDIFLAYQDGNILPEEMLKGYENSVIYMAICASEHGDWSHGLQLKFPSDRQLDNPLVFIGIVAIHAKKEDTMASGLFGNLGDSPIQLVDPIDEECIVKFRQLFVAHGIPQSKPAIAFLKRWTRSPEKLRLFRAMVEKWTSDQKTQICSG